MFVTNPTSTGNDPDDALFQAYDEATGKLSKAFFSTGWARKASEGLVGIAKRDGEWCAEVVTRYLETQSGKRPKAVEGVVHRLTRSSARAEGSSWLEWMVFACLEGAEKACTAYTGLYRRV